MTLTSVSRASSNGVSIKCSYTEYDKGHNSPVIAVLCTKLYE